MKVLFFQHVGILGGSGRSLYETILEIKNQSKFSIIVVCPPGKLSDMLVSLDIQVLNVRGLSNFDNNKYSFYRGLRWLILLREFALIIPTLLIFLKLKKNFKHFDIIHVNEITMPLVGCFARVFYPKSKRICHARAVQRNIENFRSILLGKVNRWAYNLVICIDKTVSNSFSYKIERCIIHNGLRIPTDISTSPQNSDLFRIGMVGSLNKSKGSFSLLLAAKELLAEQHPKKLEFYFYGGRPRIKSSVVNRVLKILKLKEDMYLEAVKFIESYNLERHIKLLPFEEDLGKIYKNLDLLCFPSLLNAPGRPIFEAGVYGKPSIVSLEYPEDETFIPGVTGELVEPDNPKDLTDCIRSYILQNEKYLDQSKSCVKFYKKNFDIKKSVRSIVGVYQSVMMGDTNQVSRL